MSRGYKFLILMAALGTFAASGVAAENKTHFRLGGFAASSAYAYGYSPYSYGPYGYYRPWWGMYDPYWTSPFLIPAVYTGYSDDRGRIKLTAPKDAEVFLDGALAGTAQDLKSMWLDPGIYELQVVSPSGAEFKKKLYILSGKTIQIKAELR